MDKRFLKAINRFIGADREKDNFSAKIGKLDRTIQTGEPYRIWVRDKVGIEIRVYNYNAPDWYDLDVLVGKKKNSNELEVLSYRPAFNSPESPNIPAHDPMHRYMPIYRDQFVPLLVLPIQGTLTVQVLGSVVVVGDVWTTVENQIIDLSASQPAAGALWVLLQYDNTGAVTTVDGSTVDAKELLTLADVPAPDTDNIPFCAVKLYDGQTEFSYFDDFARPFTVSGGGGGGGGYTPPVTTAANDFQVGDGAGAWIKKTLAQTATILQAVFDAVYTAVSGWTPITATVTSGTLDSPSFELSFNIDVTGLLTLGDPIRLLQGTTKYFKVSKIGAFSAGATIVTCYGGTDYTLVASGTTAISNVYYSHKKTPFGFNNSDEKWTQTLLDTSNASQASPTSGTVYNPGSLSIPIPLGAWKVRGYALASNVANLAGVQNRSVQFALSTANNSISDNELFNLAFLTCPALATAEVRVGLIVEKPLTLTTKTTYYLVAVAGGATTATSLSFRGDVIPTKVTCTFGY